MIVNKSGTLASVKRHDYLPFGEEIGGPQLALIGGRTTAQGYTSDTVRQHFTGYEADAETGLNFAQARYQSSIQGRFTSVDPLGRSANVGDPQSFNRYSYVENNPVNSIDPTGMSLQDIGIVQTTDESYARTLQGSSDAAFQQGANKDAAARQGATTRKNPTLPPASTTLTAVDAPMAGGPSEPLSTTLPAGWDANLGEPPLIDLGTLGTVNVNINTCGVNPVSGTAGFQRQPFGVPGNERPGGGQWRARRPNQRGGVHHGLDISGLLNVSPVVSNRDGTVTFAGFTPRDGGNIVNIAHDGGVVTSSVHLFSVSVRTGDRVTEGQQIGILGDTGNAGGTPPHVHYRVTVRGVEVNPATYLNSSCPP